MERHTPRRNRCRPGGRLRLTPLAPSCPAFPEITTEPGVHPLSRAREGERPTLEAPGAGRTLYSCCTHRTVENLHKLRGAGGTELRAQIGKPLELPGDPQVSRAFRAAPGVLRLAPSTACAISTRHK